MLKWFIFTALVFLCTRRCVNMNIIPVLRPAASYYPEYNISNGQEGNTKKSEKNLSSQNGS